ncbi:MAG: hypothetical protein HY791_10605 [Deltaproteobacteria bacterium]|nr:hypothetical protein [Deltaproteobacteria bacterium]
MRVGPLLGICLFVACSDECLLGNCPRGELCFEGTCTPAEEVACADDFDCNDRSESKGAYECVAEVCRLTQPIAEPRDGGEREGRDGGVASAGDGGVVPPLDGSTTASVADAG